MHHQQSPHLQRQQQWQKCCAPRGYGAGRTCVPLCAPASVPTCARCTKDACEVPLSPIVAHRCVRPTLCAHGTPAALPTSTAHPCIIPPPRLARTQVAHAVKCSPRESPVSLLPQPWGVHAEGGGVASQGRVVPPGGPTALQSLSITHREPGMMLRLMKVSSAPCRSNMRPLKNLVRPSSTMRAEPGCAAAAAADRK